MRPVFVCQQCGQCCHGEGGIFLTGAESRIIAAHLGLSPAEFEAAYTSLRHGRPEIRTGSDGACLFLDRQRCAIHQVKPAACRTWPWLGGALKDEQAFLALRNNCPGIDPQAGWAEFKSAYEALRNEAGRD